MYSLGGFMFLSGSNMYPSYRLYDRYAIPDESTKQFEITDYVILESKLSNHPVVATNEIGRTILITDMNQANIFYREVWEKKISLTQTCYEDCNTGERHIDYASFFANQWKGMAVHERRRPRL